MPADTRPANQMRVKPSTRAVVRHIAAIEQRNMLEQLDLLVLAGARALGYDLSRIDLNDE